MFETTKATTVPQFTRFSNQGSDLLPRALRSLIIQQVFCWRLGDKSPDFWLIPYETCDKKP